MLSTILRLDAHCSGVAYAGSNMQADTQTRANIRTYRETRRSEQAEKETSNVLVLC